MLKRGQLLHLRFSFPGGWRLAQAQAGSQLCIRRTLGRVGIALFVEEFLV